MLASPFSKTPLTGKKVQNTIEHEAVTGLNTQHLAQYTKVRLVGSSPPLFEVQLTLGNQGYLRF